MGVEASFEPLASGVQDWNSVLQCASDNGVVPLLARFLRAEPLVPLTIRRDLDKRYTIKAGHNALLAKELQEILQDLQSANVTALAYKGPALAVLAYGDMAFRNPSSDIDLLLRKDDLPRAKQALQSRGYTVSLSESQEEHFLKYRYHLHCERRNPELHLELHWALTPAYWPFPLDFWNRTRQVNLAGVPVLTLDPECSLLALCAHGAKEQWPKLSQVLDIGQVILSHPALDWDWVFGEARRMQRERILCLGLLLASRCIATPLPSRAREEISRQPNLVDIADDICGKFATGGRDHFLANALVIWNRPKDRILCLAYVLRFLPDRLRTLVLPAEIDPEMAEPPGSKLSFVISRLVRAIRLHGPIRVFRMVARQLWF
jgi:hypothetical protein